MNTTSVSGPAAQHPHPGRSICGNKAGIAHPIMPGIANGVLHRIPFTSTPSTCLQRSAAVRPIVPMPQ